MAQNHLQSFSKYRLLDLTPDLLILRAPVCSLGKSLFLKDSPTTAPPCDLDAQLGLRTTGILILIQHKIEFSRNGKMCQQ